MSAQRFNRPKHDMLDPVLPLQKTDACWLAETGTRYLAHEMRVGKTATVIRANDMLRARRILWITTGAARLGHAFAWQKYSPVDHRCRVITTGRDRPLDVGVTVISYNLAAKELRDVLTGVEWDVVNLDEAHKTRVKGGNRAEAIFGVDVDRKGSITERAEHVIPFSGTPAPNHYGELWTVLHALFPQAIMRDDGTPMPHSIFVNKYCKTRFNRFGGMKIVGAKNVSDLRKRIAPYYRRRKFAEAYPDAAPVFIEQLFVDAQGDLDELRREEERALLDDVQERMGKLRSEQARQALLDEVDQKLQMRIRRLTGTAKAPGIIKWAKERLEDTKKLVIFAHHKDVMDALREGLAKYKPLVLAGGATAKVKAEAELEFMRNPARRVFLGNLLAAGEAIDLSVADDVVLAESSWVPGENQQAIMRIVNMAKQRENVAWFATLAGSIDERVQETNARKTRDIMALFG